MRNCCFISQSVLELLFVISAHGHALAMAAGMSAQ